MLLNCSPEPTVAATTGEDTSPLMSALSLSLRRGKRVDVVYRAKKIPMFGWSILVKRLEGNEIKAT